MSNAVSALKGAEFTNGIAQVRELGKQGMLTVRGDLGGAKMKKAIKSATSCTVPPQRAFSYSGHFGVAWMSPDELLVMMPYAEVSAVESALTEALKGEHALVANVSDARAVFEISGPHVREVMAKLAPVDMSAGAFEAGQIRRTRLAQIPAAFWMAGPEAVHLVCFRSVAQYAFDVLCVAAQPGSEVDL